VCSVGKGFSKGIVCMFVSFCVFLCVSLDYFGFVLLVSFLGLFFISSKPRVIGWEERLRSDLFCVECDVHYLATTMCKVH